MSDVAAQILKGAPITVADFMARVADHYYGSRDPLGASGDFTTAPEISQMFGEMIGVWCADFWMQMGMPDAFNLIELGPGRGTLMADILRATKSVDGFSAAVAVHLVEISSVLRAKQEEALAGYNVIWHDSLSGLPQGGPSLFIANEFFDALPVRQLLRHGSEWVERVIDSAASFDVQDAPDDLLVHLPLHLMEAPEGKIIELSPARIDVMKQISSHVTKTGGGALIIDYGYERLNYGDTLQAMHKHTFCNVLDHIGEADITSHVDFGALLAASGATNEGVHVAGITEQGKFLTNLGIYQRMQVLKSSASADQQEALEIALGRLCAPDQMGKLFKVMALSHNKTIKPAGF